MNKLNPHYYPQGNDMQLLPHLTLSPSLLSSWVYYQFLTAFQLYSILFDN